MTRIKFLGAAAVLSMLVAAPASAQRMIDGPGMFAFVYPNGDLGIASTRPPAGAMASTRDGFNSTRLKAMTMSHPVRVKRAQSVKPY
jgi:hypothetical protein